jgi:hypothetical protein
VSIEMSQPRSRRALLAAAAGAAAATVASALDRPGLVSATDGQAVVVGGEYTATSVTKFDTTTTYAGALSGTSDTGVGVYGSSTSYVGVYGNSDAGTGVHGLSTSDIGVYGYSSATAKPAVLGQAKGGSTGIQGYSGTVTGLPAPTAKTGVYGYAAQDTAARGVIGQTTVGQGVRGVATTGYGVRGVVSSGIGASGYATTGTAVLATSANPKVGTALQAIGKVKFDNSVGIATIAAGTSSVTVTPGIDLTATSAVVATLQGSAGGTTAVRCVTVNATADTFTIYLTATATAAVKVAWHVFG